MRRLLLVLAVVLGALALAPAALAITRDEANRIALATLKPEQTQQPVILFGLPAPLNANQTLAEAGAARAGQKAPRPVAVGRKAWLFWLDEAPFARFQHPSRMLLVDDENGAVLKQQPMKWYPAIDRKKPAFLKNRAGYTSTTYRVFTNLPGAAFKVRRTSASTAVGPLALPKTTWKDDCLLTIGLTSDPQFAQDFVGMHAFAREIGMRSFQVNPARRGGRTYGGDLKRATRFLVREQDCKDVMIYISGHGYEGGEPAVQSDAAEANGTQPVVTAATLTSILREHPRTTFKIKIDACYSGRFVPALRRRPNLLVLETSSAADEVSWSDLGQQYPTRDFEPQTRTVPNPGRGEFTNANLHGMRTFLGSATEVATARAAGGSLLAHMIARSHELGASADLARTGEWTHPQLFTRLPRAPATGVQLDFSLSYDHEGPGSSFVCAAIEATSGATLTLQLVRPDGSVLDGRLQLKQKKTKTAHGTFSFGISSYGEYTVKITATKGGTSVTETKKINVTERPGKAACGP